MTLSIKKIISLIAVLALLLAAFPAAADSAPSVDFGATGSITITLHDNSGDHNVIPGAVFRLYFVAEAYQDNTITGYRYTEAFADCGLELDLDNAEALASSLAEYAEANNAPYEAGEADEEGAVVFSDLALGLYLIIEEGNVDGYYPVIPFLVTVPMANEDGTGWIYDVVASPKAEGTPVEPPANVSLTVRKVWQDEEGENRPASVTVALLADGEVIDTVVLDESNNWTYTWSELDGSRVYTVQEVNVPNGYIVSYAYNDFGVVVTNTEKIVQTGQLNWPVPVLAGAGALLLILGVALVIAKKRKKGTDA